MESRRECDLYTALDGAKQVVQCTCCSHRCTIPEGREGICKIRYNKGGKLYLSVYGRPCALHVDPVEKKPLHHFLPGTLIYSIGTFGCNFQCSFCQNWDISQLPVGLRAEARDEDVEDLATRLAASGSPAPPERVVSVAASTGCRSLAFTYNEPSIWAEYSHDIGELAKACGLPCVYVTNGFMTPEHIDYIQPYIRAMNIDLKSWSNKFYRKECGGSVEAVKDSIARAHSLGIWVEVTTLVIPSLNDSHEELQHIAEFLVSVSPGIPWHLSAFHPDYKMQDRQRTPLQTLERAYAIGKAAGLRFVYLGNVCCPDKENTICPHCGATLISRNGYKTVVADGFRGVCRCGETIEGFWE